MKFSIIVTEEGIEISTREEQSLNALHPIDLIKEGIVIFFSFLHPLNDLGEIVICSFVNKRSIISLFPFKPAKYKGVLLNKKNI